MYGCFGDGEQLGGARRLHDLSEVHDGDAVAEVLDRRQVVRDEEAREAHVALQVAHQVEDRRLHRDVERRHRFVRDEQRRREREPAREADALALPAGELVRIPVPQLRSQPDLVEQLLHVLVERAAARTGLDAQRLADDLAAGHAWVERRVRILEDDVHLAPERPQLATRRTCVMSRPLSRIVPSVGSSSRTTQLPTVDLPLPDSPTSPSISPGAIENETPSTA